MKISAPEQITLGHNVHINDDAMIAGAGGLSIGDNTHIARRCTIYTHNHNFEGKYLPYDETKLYKPVVIERNVWIGVNVTIVPGTKIGYGSIIGAGTLVSGEVPPLSIVGTPKWGLIKSRNEAHYHELEKQKMYGGIDGQKLG